VRAGRVSREAPERAVRGNEVLRRENERLRRDAPMSAVSFAIRCCVGPCSIADTRTTTAPRYTRRSRNRTDGGVTRPGRSRSSAAGHTRSRGPPPARGLRGEFVVAMTLYTTTWTRPGTLGTCPTSAPRRAARTTSDSGVNSQPISTCPS